MSPPPASPMGKRLCNVCKTKFFSTERLMKHIRDTHKKAEVCDTCNFVAASHGKLEEHIMTDHTPPPRPFVCRVCKMRFGEEEVLLRHIPAYHPEVLMEQEKQKGANNS